MSEIEKERKRVEKLRNEIIGIIGQHTVERTHCYDDDDEEYDDYNTDGPSPVDEEPVYDTRKREEELYLLYRNTILQRMN